jgi:hypothetical protein
MIDGIRPYPAFEFAVSSQLSHGVMIQVLSMTMKSVLSDRASGQ